MIRKRRFKAVLLVALLVLLAGAGLTLAVRGSAADKPEGAVATVTRGSVKVTVQEVGSVEPMRKVDLKSKVSGQVAEVLVDVGSLVKAGDVLVRLDPRDARRELALAASRHQVNQALLSQASAQLQFKHKAHSQGALSPLDLAIADGEVRRLQALMQVDGAEQAILRDRISYTELKSPIDGVVLARNIQPGEMVTPGVAAMVDGKPLLMIAQVERLLVRAELNQIDVARLKPGHKVQVRVDALADRTFEGEVYRMAAMAQRSERRKDSNLMVFPVDVVVDTRQPGAEGLRPGMMADITIDIAAHDQVLVVPLEALVREGGKTRLRKVDAKDKESLVDVGVGFQNEKVAEIVSGVQEGDRVRMRPAKATSQAGQ
ncbi:MAG: efflux RND transporter periplasmic adaptor subunit [Deltaproteobacteria bacterium]|nr:efflux RND transporter periplasmic adaptor subunit [Deltaproteobacteria bacterium]